MGEVQDGAVTGPGTDPAPSRPPGVSVGGRRVGLFDVIGIGLGLLAFLWGFLPFFGFGSADTKGFYAAGPTVALSLLAAGTLGAIVVTDRTGAGRPPYALAAAATALLMLFGAMLTRPAGTSTRVGVWLLLVTVLAQTGALAYSWLVTTGRLSGPKPAAPPPASPYYPGAPNYGPPAAGPHGGSYGPPAYGPPPGYSPPPGYGSPPAAGPGNWGPPAGPPPR